MVDRRPDPESQLRSLLWAAEENERVARAEEAERKVAAGEEDSFTPEVVREILLRAVDDREAQLRGHRRQRSSPHRPTPVWRLAAAACLAVLLTGFSYGYVRYRQLLEEYDRLAEELHFDEPFTVGLSTTGQSSVEVALSLRQEIISEVYVDWGDPSDGPAGVEGRIYPGSEVEVSGEGFARLRLAHRYEPVTGAGLRTAVTVRLVPSTLPAVRPETLSEERLSVTHQLWLLPPGILVDPPAASLEIASPNDGDFVTLKTEVRLRGAALSAPVYLLVLDPASGSYRHLASVPPPLFGAEMTLSQVVDLAGQASEGSVRLLAISSDHFDLPPSGTIPWQDLPMTATRHEIELRFAGTIVAPAAGAHVSGVDTVRFKAFVDGAYAALLVRPARAGAFYVQGDGMAVTAGEELSLAGTFGGRDSYEIYIGLTFDPDLFRQGDRLARRPRADASGRPVTWLGPVTVVQP